MVGVVLLISFFMWCSSSPSLSPWECSHCTTVNEMRAVLCTTCERPRLATAASLLQDSLTSLPSSPNSGESSVFGAKRQTDVQAAGREDVKSKMFFFFFLPPLQSGSARAALCSTQAAASSVRCVSAPVWPLVLPSCPPKESPAERFVSPLSPAAHPCLFWLCLTRSSCSTVGVSVLHLRQHKAFRRLRDVQPGVQRLGRRLCLPLPPTGPSHYQRAGSAGAQAPTETPGQYGAEAAGDHEDGRPQSHPPDQSGHLQ